MEWVAPAVTGLVGIVGIAGTIVTNELRAKREERERVRVADAARRDALAKEKAEAYREVLDAFNAWIMVDKRKNNTGADATEHEFAVTALLQACSQALVLAPDAVVEELLAVEGLTKAREGSVHNILTNTVNAGLRHRMLTQSMNVDLRGWL